MAFKRPSGNLTQFCFFWRFFLQLPVFFSFFFLFFCLSYPGLWKCKSVFLILKIWQYGGLRRWVQHFPRYSCKIWHKNRYFHFCKTYDHQIWQAGTSAGFDSHETNQVGACDVIKSRSRDKLKHISNIRVSMAFKLARMLTYADGFLPMNWQDHLITWSCKITCQTKIISSLPQGIWPPNVAGC